MEPDEASSSFCGRDSKELLNARFSRTARSSKGKKSRAASAKDRPKEDSIILGQIAFPRHFPHESKVVPFMRIVPSVDAMQVLHILEQTWKISVPRIVLFIVSNVTAVTNWKVDDFIKGLIRAAYTTEMWICTHGVNVGVVKAIGDAFEEETLKQGAKYCSNHIIPVAPVPKFVLLGICQEEILSNAKKLQEKVPVVQLSGVDNNLVEYNKYDLNPSHTHFIIVKGSSHKKNHHKFISDLKSSLACAVEFETVVNKSVLELVASEIPVVAILIQGGMSCVHFILDHLMKCLPVIVVKGSGGLADLISFAYYEINRRPLGIEDAEYVENVLKPELSSKISQDFENIYNNLQRLFFCGRILECIRRSRQEESEYLTIVNTNDTSCKLEDLSTYVLHALIKSQKPDTSNWDEQMKKDLLLAIDWNSPDMAVREVFLKDPSRKFQISNEIFEIALLSPKREKFISLFLKQGFQVHKYLSSFTLLRLLRESLKREFFHVVCWQGVLGYGLVTKITTDFLDSDFNQLIEELTGIPAFMNSQELNLNADGKYSLEANVAPNDADAAAAERKARTILTVWAILSNRITLAKQLWMYSEYPIHLALVISTILRKLQFLVSEIGEKEEVEKQSREFGKMATGVLDACYKEMPCRAYDLLDEENPDFAYCKVVDIAAVAKNRPFVAHPCCQKWLDNMFMGKMRIRDVTWGNVTFTPWLKIRRTSTMDGEAVYINLTSCPDDEGSKDQVSRLKYLHREKFVHMKIKLVKQIILSAFLIFPMYLWIQFKETDENDDYFGSKSDSDADDIRRSFSKLDVSGKKEFIHTSVPFYRKIIWMWSAPVTKFWVSQITYVLYLMFFSLAVLWPSCGNRMLDVIVCAWTSTYAMESVYRTYVLFRKYHSIPMVSKCLEILLLLIFVSCYAMGRIAGYGMFFDPYSGKILLCCGLIYFYYRLIFTALPISPSLGPQLYRIKDMVLKDFMNFMRLALLVMVSSGIVLQAVIYPDYPISHEMFRRIFDRAWISLFLTPADDFGEVNPYCVRLIRSPKTFPMCLAGRYLDYSCQNPGVWPYIFGVQYFMFLKLILITLLYALFTNTQSNVLDDSDVIWKFQRYQLVVDFAHRQRLPPPLNVFSYLCFIIHLFFKLCCRRSRAETKKQLPLTQYKYWRQLAYKFGKEQELKDEEGDVLGKQLGKLSKLVEDVGHQRKIVYGLKSHLTQLKTNISSIHAYLESFKLDKASEMDASGKKVVQYWSRRSPYPHTKVNRLPVTDKYVPWEMPWLQYDPIAYTLPKSDFTQSLRPFVDEDIHAVREISGEEFTVPVFGWNVASFSPAGVCLNRQSWITDDRGYPLIYEIDLEDLPRNPLGRTGLRGRGALPRWGPNHHIFLIITRWKRSCPGIPSNQLELVVVHSVRTKELSLPGGFVTLENHYAVMQQCFKTDPVDGTWQNSEEMINFFRSHVVCSKEVARETAIAKMSYQLMTVGYLDNPLNTDQAWMEVELWHLLYDVDENVQDAFKDNSTEWCLVTEDVLALLSPGLATYVRGVAHSLKVLVV